MNTTALLVDILIIGIQVLIWLAAIILSFLFPLDIVIALIEKSPAIFLFFAIAVSYTLGIIFDYIIAKFFGHFKTMEESEVYRDGFVIEILSANKDIQAFLDNQYGRLRIARATVFNLPIITISTCCFVFTNTVESKFGLCQTVFAIFITGVILTILSIIGWRQRNRVYWGYIKETVKTIDKKKLDSESK